MNEVVLGLDIGTGSTKAALIDRDGRLVAVARHPHSPIEPQSGWSETYPDDWRNAVIAATHAVMESFGGEVRAIGLSGQMHGVVLCGQPKSGGYPHPLRPAVLWSDRRSQPDLEKLRADFGPELRSKLANPIVAGMAGPTVAALRRLEPELFDSVAFALQPKDWIRSVLSSGLSGDVSVASDPSDASATLLWDVERDDWSPDLARVFGVDLSWLAPVHPSHEAVSTLGPVMAAELGLAVGTPIAAGAADTAAALFGAGVEAGVCQLSTGSGGQIARLLDRPQVDPTARTHLFRGIDPTGANPTWYAMAAIQNCGLAIDWALRLLGFEPGAASTVAALADIFEPPGGVEKQQSEVSFLPYLTGERTPHLDASLSGAWVGLRPSTDRNEIVRSVFEGVAFALRDGLDALIEAGHPIESAFLAGGGSVAPWWRQLLADALDLSLIPRDIADASVRGAGLLAWSAIGHSVDPKAGIDDGEPITPNPERVERLALARDLYRRRLSAAGV